MTTTKEILIAARALIADLDHWVQGELATANTGAPCLPNGASAIHFCAEGALCKAAGGIDNDDFRMASLALHLVVCTRLFPESVMEDIDDPAYVTVNDGEVGVADTVRDPLEIAHENILAVFDAAIEEAE